MKDPKQSTWALSPGRCAMQLSLWPVSRRWEMSSTEHLSLCVPHPGVLLSENRPQCTPASVQQSRYLYQRCWSKYLTSPLRAGPPIYISPEHPPRTEHRLSTLRIFAEWQVPAGLILGPRVSQHLCVWWRAGGGCFAELCREHGHVRPALWPPGDDHSARGIISRSQDRLLEANITWGWRPQTESGRS